VPPPTRMSSKPRPKTPVSPIAGSARRCDLSLQVEPKGAGDDSHRTDNRESLDRRARDVRSCPGRRRAAIGRAAGYEPEYIPAGEPAPGDLEPPYGQHPTDRRDSQRGRLGSGISSAARVFRRAEGPSPLAPVQAIEDALRQFPADEVIVVTRTGDKAGGSRRTPRRRPPSASACLLPTLSSSPPGRPTSSAGKHWSGEAFLLAAPRAEPNRDLFGTLLTIPVRVLSTSSGSGPLWPIGSRR
jgi:hypothetical protein